MSLPQQPHPWRARHRLPLLIALLLVISSLLLRPSPATAQATLICVNKTTANGLGSNGVLGVYASGSAVYAATANGLSISTDGGANFTNKTTANGLGDNYVNGVYASGSTVYAATARGLSVSTNGGVSFTNKTTANGLGTDSVNGVYASGSTVYAATTGGLSISTDSGASFTNKTTTNGLGSNSVNDVYASGSTVYAATIRGVSISTDGGANFTNRTTANSGLSNENVNGVHGSDSAIYAATIGGLGISTNGGTSFTNKSTANGLGNNNVFGVYVSGSTVYAATPGGLSISTDGGATFTNKTAANSGLGGNVVFGVYASGSTIYAATTEGLTICTPPVSQVQGNGVIIASGDTTPSSADGTDFGGTTIGNSLVQAFTINNTGSADLTSVAVTLSGASAFSVSDHPAATISPGSSSTFTVTFTPTTNSVVTATVNFTSNRDPYSFVVQGGVTAPGAALAFDGGNDTVSLPSSLNSQFANNRITVEGWFYPTASSGSGTPMLIGEEYNGDSQISFALYQEGTTVRCGFYNGGWQRTGTANLTLNQWQHLACTYDQQSLLLYVNGEAMTGQGVTAALPTGNGAWYLGRRWDLAEYYTGRMDEVRIWNRALSASELAAGMNCEVSSTANGLVARYGFNQGTALANNSGVTSLTDSSSNALNGTLTGFALSGSASNWAAPGSAASGVTCVTVIGPEINIQGNGVSIASGDTTPSTADHTDFGSTTVGNSVVRTFTIANSGTAALSLTGSPLVSVSGASAIAVTSQPASSSVAAGSNTTFQLTFTPTAAGVVTATVSIANNDSNENPYTFVVQGSVPTPGAALDFDGVNDYVTLPTTLNNQFANNRITVEGWFYPTASSGSGTPMLIGEEYNGDSQISFALYQEGTAVRCGFYNGSWQQTGGVNLTLNQWQHLACTYDQQSLQVYVNGEGMTGRGMTAALPAGNGEWYLGRRWDLAEYYTGRMDEVRIWNRALTASEIANNMNCEPIGTPSGLVARYGFNQGTAIANNSAITSLTDGGSSYNGTLTNFALNSSTSNWVAPGSAASGVACVTTPEIDVQGNGVSITSGDTTPSTSDDTDFGRLLTSSTAAHTFTINNSGAGALTGVGVTLTGASAFQLTATPASSVAAGGSSDFTLSFTPSTNGVYTATVSIASNDSNENPYTFVVQGIRTGSNVAVGKAATQSSTYDDPCTGSASKAVDGNTSGNTGDCSFSTTNNQPQDWWQVDLGAPYLIQVIDLWNRTDCCSERLSNFDLLVSTDGTNWASFYYPGAAPTTTSFVINRVVRYVKVQLRGQNYLTLAEVEVWGPAFPEIDVQGNGVSIANGDSTPDRADHTSFGRTAVSGGTLARTFTIANSGAAALTLSGSPLVTVNGDSAFSVTTQPAANSIAANSSTTFVVTFDPSAESIVTATVSIASDDSNENPYTFVVQGEGAVPNVQFQGVTCDLIDAINAANSDAASGACPAGSNVVTDTITLLRDVTLTTVDNSSTAYGSNGLPTIDGAIMLEGGGYTLSRSTAAGTADFRFFAVTPSGALTLNNVTLRNGRDMSQTQSSGGTIYNRGTVTLNNSTLVANYTEAFGGAIFNQGNLTLNNSSVTDNSADLGGAIANMNNGTVTLINSTIHANSSAARGGGLMNFSGTLTFSNSTVSDNVSGERGGGIASNSGALILVNSTVSGNSATSDGGGIITFGTLILQNSTVGNNSTNGDGGGIASFGTILSLQNSTVSHNNASSGGGLYIRGGALALNRTLLAGNSASTGAEISIAGATTESVYNLLGDSSQTTAAAFDGFTPGTNDITATSDGNTPTALANILSPTLQVNGSGTPTHALLPGSPAIDAAGDSGLATDQRGVTRPQGTADDIGAFELAVQLTPEIDVQGNGVSIPSGDTTPTATDNTDFGRLTASGTLVYNFTINNSGTETLTGVAVTVNGAGFNLTNAPATSVAVGSSSTFTLTFAPSTAGVFTATVSIASNDSNENPYTFVVQGIWIGSNVALGKPATQASTYDDPCTGPASKAVDGNTSGDVGDCSFSTTNNEGAQDWWQVDLQAPYLISVIDLWNRTDCCGDRLSDFDLLISTDGTNWTTFYYPDTAPTTTSFVINAVARYVKVQLRGQNYLTLAEVQVWGPPLPEIDVQGNGVSIADGDSTPATADHTNFGRAAVTGSTIARTFTITNSGAAALTLSGSPRVTVNGDSAFSVTTQPTSASIAANSSAPFVVTFDPSSEGIVTATVSIANDDSDENPYTFVVQGEGLIPNVQLNGVSCDLIDAITAANSDAASGSCPAGSGADTITLLRDVALSTSNNDNGGSGNALPAISSAITLEGSGHTLSRTSGAPAFRLFYVASSGTLTLTQITLTGGAVSGLTYGGAIVNSGTLTVNNSTLASNSSTYSAGAIANLGGTLTVNNSTLSANTAGDSNGGAIYNSGTLTVNNSTFSANSSNNSGGAISNHRSGTLTVNNSTFSSNSAAHQGGAIHNWGTATLVRSLLSGNHATEADELYNALGNLVLNIPAGVVNSSHNLFGHSNNAGTANFTRGATDIVPTQPLAAILNTTLADNGGPSTGSGAATWTHTLVTCSPALDAAGDSGFATDQRGIARPQGSADDIGAFELVGVSCPTPEIDLRGNNVSIANGDSTPGSADHTDFGSVAVNSGTVVRTFTISNTGTAALTLSGSPLVNVTGNSAFRVSSQPASSSVAAGGSSTFQLTFAPTISGTITATVSIANNDSDETPYTFVVQGAAAGQIDRDNQVTQADYTAVYQPTPQSCANVPAPGLPIHTLTPTLRNNTSNSYQGLYFVVTELGYTVAQSGNVPTLCNADGGNGGGVGARVTATAAGLGDGFNPNESFAQAFQVGLPVRARYRLFVNLYARPATVTAAEQGADTAANLIGVLGWEFDENGNLITSRQVFLPLIAN